MKNYLIIEIKDGYDSYWECIDPQGEVMYRKDTYDEIVVALWHQNISINEVKVFDADTLDYLESISKEYEVDIDADTLNYLESRGIK